LSRPLLLHRVLSASMQIQSDYQKNQKASICGITSTSNTYVQERSEDNRTHNIPEYLSHFPAIQPKITLLQRNKQPPPLLSLRPKGPRCPTTKPPAGNKRNQNYHLPTGAMDQQTCNGSGGPSPTSNTPRQKYVFLHPNPLHRSKALPVTESENRRHDKIATKFLLVHTAPLPSGRR